MSDLERNKGKLYPVSYDLVKEKALEKYSSSYDDIDYMIDELCCDSNFMKIGHNFYRCVFEVESDNEIDLCDVDEGIDGVIEFHTIHYNGGGSLEEVIESGLKSNRKENTNG